VDRLLFAGFIAGGITLIFAAGMSVSFYRLPPHGLLRDADRAGQSLLRWIDLRAQGYPEPLWHEDRGQGRGLIRHKPGQAFEGYTLYTAAHPQAVVLTNMAGETVHRWEIPFNKIWPDPSHIALPADDHQIYIRRAHVYPDGDLLAGYVSPTDTPYGYGLVRFDRAGRVQWRFAGHFHHDFAVAKDKTIYALTQQRRDGPPERLNNLHPHVLEDFIVALTPDGAVKSRVSVLQAMLNSPYSPMLKRVLSQNEDRWDLLHTNTISLIGAEYASHYDAIEPGNVMVLARNLNLVMVIDLNERAVVWGMTGPWHRPHDPEPLPNGHIMLFDNQRLHGKMAGSRVIELDPASSEIVWSFAGTDASDFFSSHSSRQQVLPNGNVLIAEAEGGRIMEVTRGGDRVWSFVTPVRRGETPQRLPIMADAVRYPPHALPFVAEANRADGAAPAATQPTQPTTHEP
jgi:hypothetical protein